MRERPLTVNTRFAGDFEFFYALTANRARPHSLGLGLEQAARSRNEIAARHGIWGLWQKGLESVDEAISVTASLHDLLLADGDNEPLSEESQTQVLRVAADLWSHHPKIGRAHV